MADFLCAVYATPTYSFIAIGGILLIIELLGVSGYALWSGISAFIVSLISLIAPFSWSILWILFAVFTLITAYVWWLWLKKYGSNKSREGTLNQPQKDLIGIKTIVIEPIINGSGRIKIKDGTWSASSNQDMELGQKVEVIAVNGLTLEVVKCL